jgi:amino acid efflux transporter
LLIWANLSAAIWAVSRMVWSAAQEGLLPATIADLSGGLPRNAIRLTVSVLLLVLCAAWAGVFDLGALLATAGQNFLILYAAAALALMRLSDHRASRFLGSMGMTLVIVLIVARGISDTWYPAALILMAAVLTYGKRFGNSLATETRS